MPKVSILPGQCLIDLALEHLGSEEAVFQLARLNGLSVTDDLVPGNTIELGTVLADKRVVRFFTETGYHPAAGTDAVLVGIGYWAVFIDFQTG